jgi:hypothetical protein
MLPKIPIFNPWTKKLQYFPNTTSIEVDINTLKNNEYKITYFEIISGASGSITIPTGATIQEGEFGESGNSILSELTISNKPNYQSPVDGGGNPITANLNTDGTWVATAGVTDVALIYVVIIKAMDYYNLDLDYIIQTETLNDWTLGYPTYDLRYAQIGTDGENFEAVKSILNTPPAHVAGERYLIGTTPTGVWAVGYANYIAESDGANWIYTAPISGYRVFVDSTLLTYQYSGSWIVATAVPILQSGNALGARLRIATLDNNDIDFWRNGTQIARFSSSGAVFPLNPTATTQSVSDNSNRIATTKFVKDNLANIDTTSDLFLLGGM